MSAFAHAHLGVARVARVVDAWRRSASPALLFAILSTLPRSSALHPAVNIRPLTGGGAGVVRAHAAAAAALDAAAYPPVGMWTVAQFEHELLHERTLALGVWEAAAETGVQATTRRSHKQSPTHTPMLSRMSHSHSAYIHRRVFFIFFCAGPASQLEEETKKENKSTVGTESLVGMAFVDTILGESTLTTLAVHPNARRRGIAEVWGGGATQPPNTLPFCSASCVSTRAHQGCIPVHNPSTTRFVSAFLSAFPISILPNLYFGGRILAGEIAG